MMSCALLGGWVLNSEICLSLVAKERMKGSQIVFLLLTLPGRVMFVVHLSNTQLGSLQSEKTGGGEEGKVYQGK